MGDGIPRRGSKSCCSRQSRLLWLDRLKSRLLAVSARREQEGRGTLTLSSTTPPRPVLGVSFLDGILQTSKGTGDQALSIPRRSIENRFRQLARRYCTIVRELQRRCHGRKAIRRSFFLALISVNTWEVPSFLAQVDPPVRQRGGSSGSSSCMQVFSCRVRESKFVLYIITRLWYRSRCQMADHSPHPP
jgi:hypothetical protein